MSKNAYLVALSIFASLASAWAPAVRAAVTDLADSPLASGTSASVKPNVFFILDDSGSMDRDYMPDGLDTDTIGYRNHLCNTIYYNPDASYTVPKDYAGTDLNNASQTTFTAAYNNGYYSYTGASSTTSNLTDSIYWTLSNPTTDTSGTVLTPDNGICNLSSFSVSSSTTGICYTTRADKNYNSGTPALHKRTSSDSGATWTAWSDVSSCTEDNSGTGRTQCKGATDSPPTCPTGTTLVWKKNVVSATSSPTAGDERLNYAKWYSYYRTRLMMMKAASGLAFAGLTNKYRIGFMTISPGTYGNDSGSSGAATGSTVSSSKFLKIADFDSGAGEHRDDWYSMLYKQTTSSYTPLRSALTAAGRYYAGKDDLQNKGMIPSNADDPVQYSCQQNFTILTTDGYWNGGSGRQLDGISAIGNQDGDFSALDANNEAGKKFAISPYPIYDGATQTRTTTDKENEYQMTTTGCTTTVSQLQERTATLQAVALQAQAGTSKLQKQITQLQARTNQLQKRTSSSQAQESTSQLQKRTYGALETRQGNGTSWGAWTGTSSCTWDTSGTSSMTSQRQCRYATSSWSAWADESTSCLPQAVGTSTSGGTTWLPGVECQYTDWTAYTDVGSCSALSKDTSGTWSRPVARQCQTVTVWSAWTDVSTCDANSTTECQWAGWTAYAPVSSCTYVARDTSDPYNGNSSTNGLARECSTSVTAAFVDVSSCTATSTADASGYTTQCQYTSWTPYANVSSCTDTAQSTAPNYTVGTATRCQVVDGASTSVSSCTPSATQRCQYSGWSGWTASPSCTAVAKSVAAPYVVTARECQTALVPGTGHKMQYRTFSRSQSQQISGGVGVGPVTDSGWTPASPSWQDAGACTATGAATVPYDPMPSRRRPVAGEPPLPTAPCTEWPCVSTSSATGGSSNSLADVAQYYYVTDLRPNGATGAGGNPVSENNVPAAGTGAEDDKATWQHMTTFTMGLGLSGTLPFQTDYKTASTGTFADIRAGTTSWPAATADSPSAIDDLWHAAVNGRGQYFSASNPNSVVSSLNSALAGINARVASAAAAATSTLEPVAGDNYAFIAKYVTSKWTGDVEAKTIALADDPENNIHAGDVSSTPVWSAATKMLTQVGNACDNRVIHLFRAGATNNLVPFKWNTFACDSDGVATGTAVTTLDDTEKTYFGSAQLSTLGQYASMTDGGGGSADQRGSAVGAPLVNFLRGERGAEGFEVGSATKFYRAREGILGDIVSAQPLYVREPKRNYLDAGYAQFKTDNSNRAPVVYIAANDGMLHAFDAAIDGGTEKWAFIPSTVLPNLHKLADTEYGVNHRYFTDGAPVSGDVFNAVTSTWHTILVGGLNKGGNSYYALDITDPNAPKALWQFTDADLGYSYGNPVIGKLNDGKWYVFVTSGINNADGKGYLYVLNAMTGAQVYKIATPVGSAGTPSGLTKISSWVVVDSNVNNTIHHIYGVDLLGNVWRFDVNDIIAPAGREASLLLTVTDGSGNPQPITTRPRVALVGNNPWVYVGTGRYLGLADLSDNSVQSVYGFKDDMSLADPVGAPLGPMIAEPRTDLTQQTMVNVGSGLTATRVFSECNTVTRGWYVDLPDTAERVNVDMKLEFGTLIVATNVPLPSACRVGGYSWLNWFDTANACGSTTLPETNDPTELGKRPLVGERLADSLVVGDSIVQIGGKVLDIKQFSDGTTKSFAPPINPGDPVGRRLTWREVLP